MSPVFNLWEKSLYHPGLSSSAVNGENVVNAAYSASGRGLNSGADVCLVDSEIFFMTVPEVPEARGDKRRLRSERVLGVIPQEQQGFYLPPEKEPGAAEWPALSDYKMRSGMDETDQAK